ncbi:MAG TPA: alpha/beta fold hydrolase [Pirellulales bacterium]|nr:alpha/beta fold hydrolase [Pirellulales bacterium]
MFLLGHGYRVIAHGRRGHGRSSQTADGRDMDRYADDLTELTSHLDLKHVVHVGHSTGGGEVVRFLARHLNYFVADTQQWEQAAAFYIDRHPAVARKVPRSSTLMIRRAAERRRPASPARRVD